MYMQLVCVTVNFPVSKFIQEAHETGGNKTTTSRLDNYGLRCKYLKALGQAYPGLYYIIYHSNISLLCMYCTVLYCIVLYCTVLYCTLLYCTVLCCTVLYCTVL